MKGFIGLLGRGKPGKLVYPAGRRAPSKEDVAVARIRNRFEGLAFKAGHSPFAHINKLGRKLGA